MHSLRPLAAGMLVLGAVLPHLPGNPGVPCPLRTMTGVPCPFCGSTTAVKAVVNGHLHQAVSASPLGLGVALIAVVVVLRPRWVPRRMPLLPIAVAVAASWVWQLVRFGFL
jgi:hypothetical protein